MSKADDILKKYGITPVRGSEGSSSKAAPTASNQKTTGTSSSKADSILAKYGITPVRGSEGGATVSLPSTSGSAQNWIDSSKSYLSDAEKYLSSWRKRDDNDEEYASLMKRNSSLIAEAYNWRNQYAEDDEAVSYINEVISALSNSRGSFKKYLDYYGQWETEDDYNKYVAYQKDRDEKSKYDLDAGQKEIEALEAELKELKKPAASKTYANDRPYAVGQTSPASGYTTGSTMANDRPYAAGQQAQVQREVDPNDARIRELEKQISQKKQYLNQAKHIQEGITLSGVVDNTDFKANSGYVSTEADGKWDKMTSQYGMGYEDLTYEYINNLNGIRDEIERKHKIYSSSGGDSTFKQNGYDLLNENEIAIYNYYYAKEGKEAAEKYLNNIQETLNIRKATGMFETMEGKTAQELLFGIAAGFDQFESGMKNLVNFKDDYIAQTAYQIASGMVREDLADNGAKLPDWMGGASLGQVAYDTITTSANMAPSILVGLLNPTAGSLMMGASAAGGAYQQALHEGFDKDQARGYSILVGASEVVMEKLLGGISAFGGNALGKNLTKNVANADTALKMVAKRLGGSMISEFTEEYLQEVLDPWFQNMALGTDKEVKLFSAEALYSGILGALTAGIMEGPTTIYGEAKNYSTGKQLKAADISAARLAEIGKTFSADSVAYQLAGKVDENTGAYALGRLFNEIGATLTDQNKSDIANALVEKNFDEITAKKNAEILAYVVEGGQLTDRQAAIIEANTALAEVARTVLIDANSTVNQRTKGYNEALMALAKEKASPNAAEANVAEAGKENAPASDKVDAQKESGSEGSSEVDTSPSHVSSITSIKNRTATIKLEDGSEVSVKDADLSPEDGVRIETIAKIDGISAADANAILGTLRVSTGASAQMDSLGASEAYRYGRYGLSKEYMAEHGVFVNSLTEAQRDTIYEIGQRARQQQVASKQTEIEKSVQEAKAALENEPTEVSESRSYRATLEDGISALSLNESQKASYKLADQIAEAAKVNIRVYVGKTGEHGYYNPKTDEIYLNLNATNKSRKSMMAFTLGHELVHRAKKGSPAKYEAFANFLVEQYGKQGSSVDAMIAEELAAAKEFGIEMSYDKAFEEVVCNACQRMLLDTDAGQKLAAFGAQNKQNKSFLDDVKRWITEFMDKLRSIFAGVDPDSMAAKEFAKFDESVKQILADMYVDMTIDAGENLSVIQNAFGKDTQVHANEHGEFTMANSEDGSKKVFNLVTWNNGGRETLEATLLREGYTEDEVNAALTIMDEKQRLVESIANEVDGNGRMAFPEQGGINEATLTTDLKDGHSVLSALVSNGDYPVNIDLLMVCKKRKAYQRVINRLCETGLIQQATVDALAIAEINKILGKYGFETACLGCFVESRRLRIQEWAQTICSEWNSEVKKRNPNAKAFGFGKGEATLTPDEVMKIIGELESGGEKNDKGNLNLGQGSAVKRMGVLLDKVPSLQRTLSIEDLVTPDGLTSLRSFDSNLFSMVKSRYGSNSPKFVQEFNPYNHELAKYGKVPTQYESLREYLYAIGGARMQSFSDFIIENWFDYCQIVADLAARKLPMHTYTKEIALAKLFGLTGIKINMSLIPDVDRSLGKEFAGLTRNAKGELELIWADKDRFKATGGKSYMQSINFADAIALQNDPRYSANVGTIAVGISDKHIEVMLDDARIRMIIPYHSSGMNPIFADLMGTSYYKDYTNFQNTTIKQIYNSKGQKVTLKLDKTQAGNLTGGFQFNEVLQDLGDARAAAEAYKEWCADSSKHTITIKGETYTAELTPKFNDFSGHQNYYKLLEDFNTYDCISEEAARQGDVQQIYPEDFDKILTDELKAQEKHRQKQEESQAFDKAMGEIESYLKNHSKADTVYYANQHGIKLGAKDKKLNATEKEKLKKLQAEGVSFKLPHNDTSSYQEPAYHDWQVEAALYDALGHSDKGQDNLILVGNMPRFITEKIGIEGDFYIYRNHAYENMVSAEQARQDKRFSAKSHYHDLGIEKMTDAIMALENPIMTIATKSKDGNPAVIMLLPVEGKNKAPLYAVLSFYSSKDINGDYSRKPHIVLTIAERNPVEQGGRVGLSDVINTAVKDGRVISFNEKMRDYLTVNTKATSLGIISGQSLMDNLARFRKEIKYFREKNNIDYKLPVGEDTSPRALLANAFDTVITNPIEKNKLQEYKKNVAMLNEEEVKLRDLREQIKDLSFAKGPKDTKKIRSLQFEANQAANRINTLDKMLLRFEASAPLQNVLNREKELAYKRADKKRKDDLAAYRERAAKTQRELLDRWEESRKRGIEGRQKTAMRHKIKDVVNDLNQYLLKGTKDRHVPIGLQKAVAEALNAVNMDTVGAEERIAKLNAELMKAKTPEAIQEISKKIEHIREMGDRMDEKLKRLKTAYDEFINSDDPLIANSHDDAVSAHMMKLIVRVGDTPLREMTLDQLQDVYDVYKVVLATIRNANKSFKDNKNREISTRANQVMAEIDDLGVKRGKRPVFMNWIEKFGWDGLKPVYAMEHIGSQGLIDAYNNVRAGEDTWAKDIVEAREYYLEKFRKYKYDSWDFEKKHKFTSTTEMNFELTLDQIMSLYAYSKRDQAADHLKYGGIVFDPKREVVENTKSGIKVKYNVADATAYNISEETLADIIGTLTEDQKGFVDEMQTYLSDVMGAKGNEVSLTMYDVKLFREKHYFPLKSAHQYMAKAKEQAEGKVKIKNSGFSKETKPHAKNPIVLSSFMDVWSSHVNEMSMYHAFVLPMEDFDRIYHYTTPSNDVTLPAEGVVPYIENAYGSGATEYIEQMLKDLNGGARSDSRTGFINKMMGLFKKGAVFASLSVVVQQPSAIARAAALVDTKYFIGPKVDQKRHKALWDEVKQYAPVAIIKEMGYFDTNMGKSTQDFIMGQEYSGFSDKMKALVIDSNYRDEVLSKAPALADEIAWCGIWEAVKRETKANNPGMDVTSEEFLNKVGERFTEVIVKTQVYDSVLSRSALMRSKDTGLKMATAFMAEPTTSINMVADALLKGKRGNRKYCRTAIGAVIASQILNSILVSFVYAGRDDDEDETYAEKYIGTLSGEVLDSLNPAGYIPFIKDIVSIVQGYDVERSDMAVVSDLWKAWQNLSKDDVSVYRKVEGFAGSIAQIFGLPVKNIMRDARGIYQTVMSFVNSQEKTTKAGIGYAVKGAITGKTATNKEQLYEARMAGDKEHATRVEARYGDTDSADAAVRAAIKDSFMADEIDEATALKRMVLYAGMDASEAHWTMDDWKYRKAVGSDDGYSKYGRFYDAVRTGKNLKAVVKEYTDNGIKPSTLSGQITEKFKPEYVKMPASQRASMKGYLVNAYALCGIEREDAMENIAVWDWEAQGYDGATAAAVRNYNEHCAADNVPKDIYLYIRKFSNNTDNDVDENGKSINYSAMKKIMAEIDAQRLTAEQKTAIARSLGWVEKNIQKYKTW